MSFRLQCRCAFLTYPQCDTTKEAVLSAITSTTWQHPIQWAVVAHEKHKDGTPHLHCVILWEKRVNYHDATALLDGLAGKHGNYQAARSPVKTLRYVTKDNEFVTYGDLPDLSKTPKITDIFAKTLMDGGTFQDCYDIDAGAALGMKRKLDDFATYCQSKRVCDNLIPWVPPFPNYEDLNVQLIAEWLARNIKQSRKPRQQQLFIWGTPGVGKSRLISQLCHSLRVYHIPRAEDFYDSWENNYYDVAVFDEFKGQKTIQWLNSWLDGYVTPLRKKGSQCLKTQNIPTIIVSNYPLYDPLMGCYKKESVAVDALKQRLIEVYVSSPFNIFPELDDD